MRLENNYRAHRAADMLKPNTYHKRKPSTTAKKSVTVLTEDEKSVMKLLGLTKKQMLELRESIRTDDTDTDSEDCSVLFKGDDYTEE